MKVTIRDAQARAKVGAGTVGSQRMRTALSVCVENIKSDTYHYVPKLTGNLRLSCDTSRGEEGLITWNAVDDKGRGYAFYVYHMQGAHWTTPGTGPQWVERAAASGGLERWSGMIRQVLNG